MQRFLRLAGTCVSLVLATVTAAAAHPLGNFTVNHLSRITTAPGTLDVRYVLDMAEIPSFALDRSLDVHGTPSDAALQQWARHHAAEIAPQLLLTVDGAPAALQALHAAVRHRPGAGGLPTTYFTVTYRTSLAAGAHQLTYRDQTESGRIGWVDVVFGDEAEPTDALQRYPAAVIGSPRERPARAADMTANGLLRPDATPLADTAVPQAAPGGLARMNALSDVLARGAGSPLIVIGALLLAVALGALHALEPGHGKTLLAVSLVGARATRRQALVLASALTVAHTSGVLLLGVVVLLALPHVATEAIYPWITLGSGALVTILGARAVAREVRRRLPVAHVHEHVHPHSHPHQHDHVHGIGHDHHHDRADLDDAAHARAHAIPGTAPLSFRSAVIAAMSGNIAPCPAAFVVLLAAIQLHQVGYGLALIVAFSVGLAAVLTLLGIAVVRGAAWLVARPQFDRVARLAPLVTAGVIATVGAVMIGEGLAAQIAGLSVPLVAALVLLAVVGYAFAWHQHQVPVEVHA